MVQSNYTFATAGIWVAQFYVTDVGGNKLYGEPIQVKVTPNADDAPLNSTDF